MSNVMKRIENYNAGVTMCMERLCDNLPTHYDEIEYHGLKVFIALCDIHANKAMSTYSGCVSCGMFDTRPDPEYLADEEYCNETGKLANPGDKACDKYWNKEPRSCKTCKYLQEGYEFGGDTVTIFHTCGISGDSFEPIKDHYCDDYEQGS